MCQKTNPIGNRLGIIKGWDSSWFGGKDFALKVVEDEKIRNYLNARISKGGIAKIVIERTLKRVTVTINTSRPGIIIGKGGQEVDKIKEELIMHTTLLEPLPLKLEKLKAMMNTAKLFNQIYQNIKNLRKRTKMNLK